MGMKRLFTQLLAATAVATLLTTAVAPVGAQNEAPFNLYADPKGCLWTGEDTDRQTI
ncbi:MAG: hypothetical protein U0350_41320 [Caldilineaceae bacterium]